jgi:hypothetical protein
MQTDPQQPDRDSQKTEIGQITLPTDVDQLARQLASDPDLKNTLQEAIRKADGLLYRQEQDRRQQQIEADQVSTIQTVLAEAGFEGITVGDSQAVVRAMSNWHFGVYQNGDYIGDVVSKSHTPVDAQDVQQFIGSHIGKLLR